MESRFTDSVEKQERSFAQSVVQELITNKSGHRLSILGEMSSYSSGVRKEILIGLERRIGGQDLESPRLRRIAEGILLHLALRMVEWESGGSEALREARQAGRRLNECHYGEIRNLDLDANAAYHLDQLKTLADRWLKIACDLKEMGRG
jgi:hypothetical protein